jgi:integrase
MKDENKRYFIAKPTKTRKTYALVCYVLLDRKTKQYIPLDDSLRASVDKINTDYKSGLIQDHEVLTLLNDLIQFQYRKSHVKSIVLKNRTLSEVNDKIFKKFWADVYGVRFLEDPKAAEYKLRKALALIDPLSLLTASAQELQAKLKSSGQNVRAIRAATDRLNQILKYLKRDIRLQKPKDGLNVVQYVTKLEFDNLVKAIDDPVSRDFATTLFCSGLRLSEALALTPTDLQGDKLNVTKQLAKDGTLKLPKRDRVGKSLVVPFGMEAVKRWVEFENKEAYRYKLYDDLEAACLKVFGANKSKHVSPHDLRHSHAIYLLSKGANLTQVALNLRNRVDVCQKYYTGYAHTDETLDGLKSKIE